jgi:parallel beta-helix repeat protein
MNLVTNNYIGVSIYDSEENIVFSNTIELSSYYGIYFCRSINNVIYHNNFLNNTNQAFNREENVFDNGYPSGGNYWSDYTGVDQKSGPNQDQPGSDGIGDTSYSIFPHGEDHYPLMYPYGTETFKLTITTTTHGTTNPEPGTYIYPVGSEVNVTAFPNAGYSFHCWLLDGEKRTENPITVIMDSNHTLEAYFVDDIPPEISEPRQDPLPVNVQPFQNVTVWVNVTDYGTGIKNVTLWYSLDNGTSWTIINMTALPIPSDTWITYEATIDGYENCTWVTYKIIVYDNAGNNATKDNNGYGYKYHVIPEYPSTLILVFIMATTLITTSILKIKKRRQLL